jgi:alginate O-acetyltransferase complex protein AlgI
MLFNSYEFIFGFLPIVLAVFFLLGRASRVWALRWIIGVSLFFYGWWRPLNILIIMPSVFVNYVLARVLQRLNRQSRSRAARAVLLAGIAFNVAFLGYFKYANFLVGSFNDATGTNFVLARIILPLGLSFITFQKIAFLIDVHSGRIEKFTLQDFCLFVLFFPQLIAGPIVHYREMMPQFHRTSCRFNKENFTVGLTLFAFGLFKKVFIADSIAPVVNPIYGHAAAGSSVGLLPAWIAAVGFAFQIYFDFSGYTDMALGMARMIGIRLPLNFDSPLRASSIIDFWLRWHATLTRFLTAYIYNPMALSLTRRRVAQGKPGLVGRQKTIGAFLELLMFPTLLTMFISGMWHGAGYTFIVWGVLHGVYLVINHAWRLVGPKVLGGKARYERVMRPCGLVITFVCVAASMIIFRAPDLRTAAHLIQGMLGMHGVGFAALTSGVGRKQMAIWIVFPAVIALLCPNTLEILARYGPALDWRPKTQQRTIALPRIAWEPSLVWAAAISIITLIGVMHLGGQSVFLYWQF